MCNSADPFQTTVWDKHILCRRIPTCRPAGAERNDRARMRAGRHTGPKRHARQCTGLRHGLSPPG
ncbi:hypothetical protein C6Q28_12575 [Burkholderia multivorans]|nr:hypothetical protein C6Q28_12575 [Burkholderia multivorans]